MTLGNLVAFTQTDTVRLLAWSTVAQAGWVLLPLVSLSSRAVHAAGSYLIVYVVATLLAFVVVAAVATTAGTGLAAHRGLLRTRPLLAAPLALALLTLAGLPPGIAGVVAKIVSLRPVLGGGSEWLWLALVAAVNIALGIAVYVRWLAVVVANPDVVAARQGTPEDAEGATAGTGKAEQGTEDAQEGTGDAEEGAEDAEEGTEGERASRTVPVSVGVLIAVLSALLVVGSIVPVGVV